MRVRIHVTPKSGVLDPQGKAIGNALTRLGFQGIGDVRAGKIIEVQLEAPDADAAKNQAKVMCERLLANKVIENYVIEVLNE
ncbi:MAG TPA: phosphoribosylformylglycinamidine synthase [Alphaproteobacteria bacterium]|nr:phosphoribosylformylglycinamidine synthase [Alphaproteobacteria bacterium]HAJ46490.1 phosphoribosylformylglycinamidine synthase [Alphaproteobacteria bacterium]